MVNRAHSKIKKNVCQKSRKRSTSESVGVITKRRKMGVVGRRSKRTTSATTLFRYETAGGHSSTLSASHVGDSGRNDVGQSKPNIRTSTIRQRLERVSNSVITDSPTGVEMQGADQYGPSHAPSCTQTSGVGRAQACDPINIDTNRHTSRIVSYSGSDFGPSTESDDELPASHGSVDGNSRRKSPSRTSRRKLLKVSC
jgi:hypothetical protein